VTASRTTKKTLQQRLALLLFFVFLLAWPAAAQDFIREDLRIPMADAGAQGLQALFIRPNAPGRYPLVVISHGAPRDSSARRRMSPYASFRIAMEFARRGYAVVAVMRRGYGTSGGDYIEGVACDGDGDFTRSGLLAAADIRAALDFVSKRPDVDASVIIAAGESAGGFSSLALASLMPRGLVAVITFAGGRGSTGPHQICQRGKLIEAFAHYGRTARVPTLWIYAENDSFFGPQTAQEFFRAFTSTGGIAEFIAHPAHGEDGHNFVYRGIALWTPYVDAFLRKHNLPRRPELLPMQVSVLPAPPRLSASGLRSFQDFLNAGPNKAFAVSPDGAYAWRAGMNTRDVAIAETLNACRQYSSNCELYVVNEEIVKRLSPAAPGYAR
jgi:dienelactone hydrolase